MFGLAGFTSIGADLAKLFSNQNPQIAQSISRNANQILSLPFSSLTANQNQSSLFGFSFTDKVLLTIFATVIGTVIIKQLVHD